MTSVKIVEASPFHVKPLADHMRDADRIEVLASNGQTPEEALRYSFESAVRAWTAIAGGEVACMWGVSPGSLLAGVGVPWCLTGRPCDKIRVAFARGSLRALDAMHETFPILSSVVDARHVRAVKWLRWLGFSIEDAQPFGEDGMPFHAFWRLA